MPLLTRRAFVQSALVVPLAASLGRSRRATADFVRVIWCGALTPRSAQVNAQLNFDSAQVRLLVSAQPDLSQPIFSAFRPAELQTNNRMVALPINGLQPDTLYTYAVEADGLLDTMHSGQFRTPVEGAFSFTAAFASCADTGSNHPVFDTIRGHDPLFFIHMGDFHYEDIGSSDRQRFRRAYERALGQPRQAALYRALPVAYMWDDHDYGPNDSDETAPGREAARLTYQEYVPHYPLPAGSGDVPIYQAFTIGRVRFILTDLRSARTPKSAPDNADKTMLGEAQKAWFKQELLAANGLYPLIVWVSTTPWMADPPGSGDDNWAGYTTERRELADFLEANAIQGVIMLSGDVHMLAIEDGRNNRYSSSGAPGFPIMQAAPLDRTNSSSLPDNTFSEGQFPGHQQFGLMTISDDGGPLIHIRWSGRTAGDVELVWHEMTVPPGSRLDVTPKALSFLHVAGGPRRLELPLTIGNFGAAALDWSISVEMPAPWLKLSASAGSAAAGEIVGVEVHVDPSELAYGTYEAKLRVEAGEAAHSPQQVTVTLLHTGEPPSFLPLAAGSA